MSSAPTVKGTDAMTYVGPRKRWTQQDGVTTEHVYEGPRAKAEAMFASHINSEDYDDVSYEPIGGAKGRVTLVVADDGTDAGENNPDLNAVWTAVPMEIAQDLAQHAYFLCSGTVEDEIVKCETALSRGLPYSTAGLTTLKTVMMRYYGHRLAGVGKHTPQAIELRKTLITGRRNLITVSWDGVGYVVTGGITTINPPRKILGAIDDLQRLITGAVITLGTAPVYAAAAFETKKWEWVKKAPSIQQEGKRRFRIEYTWWGVERASKVLYGGTWDPQAG